MSASRRGLLIVYAMLAHAVLGIVYWQNHVLRQDLAALAERPCEPSQCGYRDVVLRDVMRMHEAPAGGVYLVGDSIIAQLEVGALGADAHGFGVGGDTVRGVRYRTDHYPFIDGARALVLHVGVNDVLAGHGDAARVELPALATRLAGRAPLVLSAALPVDEARAGDGLNARLRALNEVTRAHCEALRRCRYVDAWDELVDGGGQLAAAHHVGDGIHLTDAGYAVWLRHLRAALGAGR